MNHKCFLTVNLYIKVGLTLHKINSDTGTTKLKAFQMKKYYT